VTTEKSRITAFSLPTETIRVLNKLQTKHQKSRSQLLRDMINFYLKFGHQSETRQPNKQSSDLDNSDANKVLKYYFQLLSQLKPKPTLVIGIAIINKKDRVLIGLRKTRDVHVKNLTWTFPSGRFNSLNFESEILKTIEQETGFTTRILQLVHARLIPDSPQKKVRVVALYYHCKIVSGRPRPGGDFNQLKWVPATDVTQHFTTSTADEVMNFLGTL